jgi:hypothetical protein
VIITDVTLAIDAAIPSVERGDDVASCNGNCNNINENNIVVDLHNCSTRDSNTGECFEGDVQLESGSLSSEQKIFPLAVDDYFMAVALLSQRLSKQQVYMEGAICNKAPPGVYLPEFWPGTRIPGPLSPSPLFCIIIMVFSCLAISTCPGPNWSVYCVQ